MSRLLAYLELLRPQQWVKNGFVLTGLLFGHAWRDPALASAAIAATVAFCLGSGATYAFNDCRDVERDRQHPDKRMRPVARGAVSLRAAYLVGAISGAAALAVALWAGAPVAWILGVYLALNLAYALGLKQILVVDVVVIASGFMLRLLAGTTGIGIEPSNWLLACGFLLTLFLGFAKRRAELARLAGDAGRHRAVLDAYSIAHLDRAIAVCAAAMAATYALYTLAAETAAVHGTGHLFLTVPWVLLGTLRYLFRLHYRGGGGDPTDELLRDPVLGFSVAGWLATVLWLIG